MTRFEALIAALRNFGKKGNVEERAETAKAASEVVNEALPEFASGRTAVMRQRKKLADIDKMLEGSR